MTRISRFAIAALLIIAAAAPPVHAVNGPQTDIYYYGACDLSPVGHKWKDCGNSAWQMTGVTAAYMEVMTLDCETSEEVTKYYYGCLTSSCEISQTAFNNRGSGC